MKKLLINGGQVLLFVVCMLVAGKIVFWHAAKKSGLPESQIIDSPAAGGPMLVLAIIFYVIIFSVIKYLAKVFNRPSR